MAASMVEPIARIIGELEELHHARSTDQSPPLSRQSLSDLELLLGDDLDANGSESLSRLFEELSSNNLSPSVLLHPIASAMDSSPIAVSILASKVYLSLLLAPNAPVFTLFTPMSFLSFLQSIRRSLKHRSTGNLRPGEQNQGSQIAPNRRKKRGERRRVSKRNVGNAESEDDVGEEGEFDMRDLFAVIEMLALMLGLVHLDRFPDSLKLLVQTMAELPVFALESCGNVGHCNKLINLCLRVLSEALKPEHGDLRITATELLISLTPHVLRPKSQARTFALGTVTSQMMAIAEESDGVKKAIIQFPKYLARKVLDKAEPRALAVESIMEIVRILAFEEQIGFVKYAVKMTQGKSNLRFLGTDLILNLLVSLKDPLGVESEDEMEQSWGIWCLEALIQRCSDGIAAIRARALSNLAQLVGFLSSDNKSKEILREIFGFSSRRDRSVEGGLNNLLRRRCMDDKAAVRKASLHLVTKLSTLLNVAIDKVVLKIMGGACSDPLISMRKAAISALSEVILLLTLP
ncbi:hypothetical protein L6164_012535 [Bauhinia variegata]|uniref:Uncharacterized protein n=1 Tax=Bauhinia variegata TaxID=167791 RepID=A0ACB9PBJ3_BAUVA|nr:hypothetical protein L6164_012535 [Bauhinia variegata]